MLSLSTLRRELGETTQVVEKFKSDGEFTITAEKFAAIASSFDCEKEASELASAIGPDVALFKVISRNEESEIPIVVSAMAYSATGHDPDGLASTKLSIRSADLGEIELGTITKSKLGPAGYVEMACGKAKVQFPTVVSTELRDALNMVRADGGEQVLFEVENGSPKLSIISPFDKMMTIPTLKQVPQRDLPPHADIVPLNTDLEVVAVLEKSRTYNSPRLRVRCANDNSTIEGLIATQPIVRCLTGQYEGNVELTEEVVGKKFQILEVQDRRRRDGELVKNDDGTVQKQVVVANTSRKREFAL